MFVRFTNASDRYRGMPLYLNSDKILSVYEEPTHNGSLVTIIWGGDHVNRWSVEEGLKEAIDILNGVKHANKV